MKSLLLLSKRQTAILLVFVLNYTFINDLHAQVCTGDITLSSQAEVDAFNCKNPDFSKPPDNTLIRISNNSLRKSETQALTNSKYFNYIELKNLMVLYKHTNTGILHSEAEYKTQEALDRITNFYFRNSGMRLLLKWEILIIEEYVNINYEDNEWTNVALLQNDLSNRGITANQFDCIAIMTPNCGNGSYGATSLFNSTGLIQLCYLGPHWVEGAGIHEYNHFLDDVFSLSGYPEYPQNHPGGARKMGEYIPKLGHLDAGIVRHIPFEQWIDLASSPWGELKGTDDSDSDLVPDNDINLPIHEKLLNGSVTFQDTDNDNLNDFMEVLAGINKNSNLDNIDTDGDGLNDGEDLYPLYPINEKTFYENLNIDNPFNDWPLNGKYFDFKPEDNSTTELRTGYNDEYLFIGFKIGNTNITDVRLLVDANSDGWFNGSDNFEIRFNRYGISKITFKDANVFDGNDFLDTELPVNLFPFNTTIKPNAIFFQIAIPKQNQRGISLLSNEKIGIKPFVYGYGNTWEAYDWGATMFEREDFYYLTLEEISKNIIYVKAKGSKAGGEFAHFSISLDGQIIGDTYTLDSYKVFNMSHDLDPTSIKKIQLVFDNDDSINGNDRDLFIDWIILNGDTIRTEEPNVFYVKADGTFNSYSGIMESNGTLLFDLDFVAKVYCSQDVLLTTQYEVNTFSCATVQGDFIISGLDINNLDGLNKLKEIGGALIIQNNPLLEDISGLKSIEKIGMGLHINDNKILKNLNGLEGLKSIGSDLIISWNDALTNVDGLSGLTVVENDLVIEYNYNLIRCCGLYPLLNSTTVGGTISIYGNGFWCTESEIIANGPCSGEGTLIVNAKGSEANGEYAHFKVIVDGQEIGDAYTTPNYEPYVFTFVWALPNGPGMIQDVSIVFDNDAMIDGSDRNLYVQSIELNGEVIPSTGDNVTYDAGTYNGVMPWNGILSFGINVPSRKLIVNAKGSDAGDVHAHFRVIVNDKEIGDACTTSDYADYAFTLPNDLGMIQEVLIVFDNDAVIDGSDRDLYIQGIELNGVVLQAPGDYVTYDAGTYNGVMPWNGILYFAINDLYAQVCNGDIVLRSQAEVDAFNCEVVEGGLAIAGNNYTSDITNLDGLSELKSVSRLNIWTGPYLSEIDGLSGLSGNIGSITIMYNDGLENLDGLNGITSVEHWIQIFDNDELENLDGLSNITSVGEDLYISGNANLNSCCGLYQLLSSGGVAGTIDIGGNGAGCTESDIIANGPCLGNCESDITLSSQTEVDAFNCTKVTGTLTISGDDITNLDALSGLTEVDDMWISNNGVLTTLEGISELEKVGGNFEIRENPLLENLIGLSSLKSVNGSFRILSNDALSNVNGLSGLTEVGGWVEISHNGALTNIDGLWRLTEVGRMIIWDNNSLPNVDGLSGLTKTGDLRIMENDALTNIDGLSGLTEVDYEMLIVYNSELIRCCGLYPLLSSGTVGGSISIGSNGSGCTESDILEKGTCSPCCYILDLKNDGVLNRGNAIALVRKLLWISKIDHYSYRHNFSANNKWSHWNQRVVQFLLGSFNKYVEALVKCGKLSPAQGQTLILLASLSQECNFDCGKQNSNLRIEELIADDISSEGITDFELVQNYPNPVSDRTYIPFVIPESTHVLLKLTDELGREVEIVFNKHVREGFHEVELNTSSLTDGIYFYTLQTEKFQRTLPMVIKK